MSFLSLSLVLAALLPPSTKNNFSWISGGKRNLCAGSDATEPCAICEDVVFANVKWENSTTIRYVVDCSKRRRSYRSVRRFELNVFDCSDTAHRCHLATSSSSSSINIRPKRNPLWLWTSLRPFVTSFICFSFLFYFYKTFRCLFNVSKSDRCSPLDLIHSISIICIKSLVLQCGLYSG